jgi:hypothetical protein
MPATSAARKQRENRVVGYLGRMSTCNPQCIGARVLDPQQATSIQRPGINRDRQIFRALLRITDPRAVKAALDVFARDDTILILECRARFDN